MLLFSSTKNCERRYWKFSALKFKYRWVNCFLCAKECNSRGIHRYHVNGCTNNLLKYYPYKSDDHSIHNPFNPLNPLIPYNCRTKWELCQSCCWLRSSWHCRRPESLDQLVPTFNNGSKPTVTVPTTLWDATSARAVVSAEKPTTVKKYVFFAPYTVSCPYL